MSKEESANIPLSTIAALDYLNVAQIFKVCQIRGYSCVTYRLPIPSEAFDKHNKSIVHLIIDLSEGKKLENLHLDEMGGGFIFHPFTTDNHDAKLIQRDIHITIDEHLKLKLIHSNISMDEFLDIFNGQLHHEGEKSIPVTMPGDYSSSSYGEKGNFQDLVMQTIKHIRDNHFQKAVIARTKNITLPNDFSANSFFTHLTDLYTNAFTYLSYIPGIGLWVGATPEVLINIDRDRQFKTIALAATQAFNKDIDLEETTWSQKDIEEQAMVSRYIINCFKKIRLREFDEIGPRTHLSGNLVHLKTDYIVDMDQVSFPELGTVMLELLHPTSAVCGMPKEPALEFILGHEGFDRTYFSGFLGPVNIHEETNIFVNLRCMKIHENKAQLFAGAGIISNSNPEKEWNETEIKMDTLLNVIQKNFSG